MGKTAITFWNGLVSPLFDVAATVLLVAHGQEPRQISLGRGSVREKAALLARNAVNALICGAISTEALTALQEQHIRVVPWISGPVSDVLAAHDNGSLETSRFLMPGCVRKHRRHCRRGGRGGRGFYR